MDILNNDIPFENYINDNLNEELKPIYNIINDESITKDSKYIDEFKTFINYYNSIIAYDDESYSDAKKTYEILLKLNSSILEFEDKFINEINDKIRINEFVYNKIGIKNIKMSLDYININYRDKLTNNQHQLLNGIQQQLEFPTYDILKIDAEMKRLISEIWSKEITKVSEYREGQDFKFLCTNNQFLDVKHEAILLTSKELSLINDISLFEIGFICAYNDNILYITDRKDIMEVMNNDMSNLKIPSQIEDEFTNFNVSNTIVLDGYNTKIIAVYYIETNNEVPQKAIDLAYSYSIPLIKIKK